MGVNNIANGVLKILGIHAANEDTYSEEEIRLIVAESHKKGNIDRTERDLINRAFEFDNCLVGEILIHRSNIVALDESNSINDAATIILKENFSRFPVFKGNLDRVTGVVFAKDVLRLLYEKSIGKNTQKTLEDCKRRIYFVPEYTKIKDLLHELQLQRLQMAVVVDEFGSVIGLLTKEDILEELVGEIQDEYDNEQPVVEKVTKNTFRVNALSSILDVNKHSPFALPLSEEYDTLSGLILYINQDFPNKGQQINLENYRITIVSTDGRSVKEVLLQVVSKEA